MARVINFSAGPATLPLPALEFAKNEFLDHEGTGMSLIEHSHRGAAYAKVHEETKALWFAELMNVPESHEVLFMQGGATAAVRARADESPRPAEPVGRLRDDRCMERQGTRRSQDHGGGAGGGHRQGGRQVHSRAHSKSDLDLDSAAAYVHYHDEQHDHGHPVSLRTSTAGASARLSRTCRATSSAAQSTFRSFGLIYAGAQKNLGPAGITVLILRKDLAERSPDTIPKIFRYSTILNGDSLQNTIPTFPVYMIRNVLRWVRDQGGASAMESRNREKADAIYGMIDENPDFFRSPVEKDSRSWMNPVFRLPTEELEKKMIADAAEAGMVGIKGHRSVGGIRTSIYNAMEPADVARFVDFAKALPPGADAQPALLDAYVS